VTVSGVNAGIVFSLKDLFDKNNCEDEKAMKMMAYAAGEAAAAAAQAVNIDGSGNSGGECPLQAKAKETC
jgi:hypothetical protein